MMADQTTDLMARMRELVEETKDAMDEDQRKEFYRSKHNLDNDPVRLALQLFLAGEAKDYVAQLSRYINAEHDVLRLELIPAAMEERGIENMTIEGLGRLGLTGDMYVSVKAGQKPDFLEWLQNNKLGDLAQLDINPSTLKSFVKRRMNDGKDLPTDLLNVTPFTRASITRKAS